MQSTILMQKHAAHCFLSLFLIGFCSPSHGQSANAAKTDSLPYPKSTFINELVIDSARISIGDGDNWAITWADDDLQYSFFTDGKGFGDHDTPVSISPVSIHGSPPNIQGVDIASQSGTLEFLEGGENSAKVCGLVMIDKVLYAWVRNANLPGTPKRTGSTLMFSKDHGSSVHSIADRPVAMVGREERLQNAASRDI